MLLIRPSWSSATTVEIQYVSLSCGIPALRNSPVSDCLRLWVEKSGSKVFSIGRDARVSFVGNLSFDQLPRRITEC